MNEHWRNKDPGDSRIIGRGQSIVSVEVAGAIQAAEFDIGGWRPDGMISGVTEGEGGEVA